MWQRISVALIYLMVLFTMCIFLIREKSIASEHEKRLLATWPMFTMDSYLSGYYFHQVSNYINDHFPLRDRWVSLAQDIRYNLGIHRPKVERVIVVQPEQENEFESCRDTISKSFNDDFKTAYSGEMLIIDGRVYPQGAGSTKMGIHYATMINEYADKLYGICNVFSCVAPLASAFIPVKKYAHYNTQNKQTLEAIQSHLRFPAHFCDVFGEMDKHFGEMMFYGTDHHWNAKGAYYGYRAFCNAAGLVAVELDSMIYQRRRPFLGSLYDLTQDPEVRMHPDTVEVYIPKVETQAWRYPPSSLGSAVPTKVFCNSNNYGVFLCGDSPLIKIKTGVKNGRRAALVKNSMGNAFAVYLVSHYEEIWVIDFRYSGHNLMEVIIDNSINDLVFAVGMYAAMSHGTIGMMRNLSRAHHPALGSSKDSNKLKNTSSDSLPTKTLKIE